MPRRPARDLAAPLLAGCALACSPPPGHPPVARIDVAPAYVPSGDGFATRVALDGRRSCDEVDRPETCLRADAGAAEPPGLGFSWRVLSDQGRLDDRADAALSWARVSGARPVAVELTVVDQDGASASATATIGIALPAP